MVRVEDLPFGTLIREARIAHELRDRLALAHGDGEEIERRREAMADALADRVGELDRRRRIVEECRARRVGGLG